MEETVIVQSQELQQLIQNKLAAAGLSEEHAAIVAEHLVFADASGIHSHGAVRVDYYAERIAKGGMNRTPQITFEETGPSSGIVHGQNGAGQVVVLEATKYAIEMAKRSGIAAVGVRKTSHSGALSYYVKKAAEADLIALSMCQSDSMVVPFGGKENYFGTNPIAFAAPRKHGAPVVFDMATTVQAWGKILDARSKDKEIPATWAVDAHGKPTTNPHHVHGLFANLRTKRLWVDDDGGYLVWNAPWAAFWQAYFLYVQRSDERSRLRAVYFADRSATIYRFRDI